MKKRRTATAKLSCFNRLFCCLVLSLLFLAQEAQARYRSHRQKYGTITLQKSFYKDLKVTSGPDFPIQDTWDVELAYRFYRIFMLTLNASVGDESSSDRTDYGAGFRIGLPGFFFFGAKLRDISRRRMKHPVDTSLYFVNSVSDWKTSSGSTLVKTASYRFGFTADIFMFNPTTYLRLDLGAYNTRGNAHMSHSIGLGYEF